MIIPIIIMVMDSMVVDSAKVDSTTMCNNIVEMRMSQTIMRQKVDSIIHKLQTDSELLKAIREKRKKK